VIDPVVRPASDGDRGALTELAQLARESVATARGGSRWLESHPEPEWASEELVVLVAELDSMVVGYLVGRSGNDRIMQIQEVYVRPECRELGYGDGMVEAVLTVARELGCRSIEAEALPGDRDTKNLWERAGITARLITVSKDL